jgi:hypothetical protein
MGRVVKLRWMGIFLGASTGAWLTLLGQWVGLHQSAVPLGLAFPILMLWLIVMIVPAQLLAHAVGWNWGIGESLSTGQLAAALAVNVVLWGFAGMIPAAILKSQWSSRFGKGAFILIGMGLMALGCIIDDGLWLRNLGLFSLLVAAAVHFVYPKWFKVSSADAPQSMGIDHDSSSDITNSTSVLKNCSWLVIVLGVAVTAWSFPVLWAFLPYLFFAFANAAARQIRLQARVLALGLFSLCLSIGWFWHAAHVNYDGLYFRLIAVVIGQSCLAAITWRFVLRARKTS